MAHFSLVSFILLIACNGLVVIQATIPPKVYYSALSGLEQNPENCLFDPTSINCKTEVDDLPLYDLPDLDFTLSGVTLSSKCKKTGPAIFDCDFTVDSPSGHVKFRGDVTTNDQAPDVLTIYAGSQSYATSKGTATVTLFVPETELVGEIEFEFVE